MGKICQKCGASNTDSLKFCSGCGSDLSSDAGQHQQPIAGDTKARTMILGNQQGGSKEKGAQTNSKSKDASANRTVFGMPAIDPDAVKLPAGSKTSGKKNKTPEKQPRDDKRTVLGLAAVTPAEPSEKNKPPLATPSQPPPPKGNSNRTVMGIAAVVPTEPIKKKKKPPMATPSRPPGPANAAVKRPAKEKHTVLGMPAVVDGQLSYEETKTEELPFDSTNAETGTAFEASSYPQKPSKKVKTPAERKKQEKPSPVDDRPSPKSALSASSQQSGDPRNSFDEWPDQEPETERRSKGLQVAIIVAIALVLVGAITLTYLLIAGDDKVLVPHIFPTGDGKGVTVSFSFPKAPPGTVIQISGQTVQVAGGQAQIIIQTSQLKLGINQFPLIYTEPGTSPKNMSFPIALRHSITTDLNGLMTEDPSIAVNFQIAPDITLAIAGKPVQVINGLYVHRIPLAEISALDPSADSLIHRIPFQLNDAKGTAEQGEHVVAIPVTKLQIDRPAESAIVAVDAITCAGVTEKGASVTVNGQAVGVTVVGFNTRIPLARLGDHQINVTARAPGKASRTQTVKVTRIEDLSSAIETWSKDLDKKLDYPTVGRDPNVHANKKIKLSGRVVNINTEKGVTVFLLYIDSKGGCPAGARCAVYVIYRGETEAGLQSWVDTYGIVKGTRTVDLSGGKKLDVPAVEAKFVVKTERKREKRRRR